MENGVQVETKKNGKPHYALNSSFIHAALCVCVTTSTHSTLFWFCLQVIRHAGSPKRLDCLALQGTNQRQVYFARTLQRITNLGIKPGASNRLITSSRVRNFLITRGPATF